MKKLFAIFILSALVLSAKSFAEQSQDPLMIVRFNNEFVNYERSLNKAVKAAVRAKESVFFDVVSIVPQTKSSSQNKKLRKIAETNAQNIIASIRNYGINEDRIRLTYQESNLSNSDEVHLFVR